MAINKPKEQDLNQSGNRQQATNGIVTVNDSSNPTPEERDEKIGREPDTDRLLSERESVQQGNANREA